MLHKQQTQCNNNSNDNYTPIYKVQRCEKSHYKGALQCSKMLQPQM